VQITILPKSTIFWDVMLYSPEEVHWSTPHYIPQDSTQCHCREKPKSSDHTFNESELSLRCSFELKLFGFEVLTVVSMRSHFFWNAA
jgi:hypothetical protein